MAARIGHRHRRVREGWRRLGWFWLTVLLLLGGGTGVLSYLGPPPAAPLRVALLAPPAVAKAVPAQSVPAIPPPPAISVPVSVQAPPVGRDTPGPVADPDPALRDLVSDGAQAALPKIASDGRAALRVYAAGFDHTSRRPRIGLLLANVGMNEAESDAAIRDLPPAVSLAVSPYAAANGPALAKLLATARTIGHEYLIELPLEPTGYPLNDPGPETLLTSQPFDVNQHALHWALSRIEGYVGAVGLIGTMRGERFAGLTDQMDAMLAELAERGLLYVDPRATRGAVDRAWGRHVDLVVDDPADQGAADRAMIDAKLNALEQVARDTGAALGLVMRPTPVTVARIVAWSNGLLDRGLTLAPVSAVALPPADATVKLSERE